MVVLDVVLTLKNALAACSGPGYESPRAAMLRGPREKLLYVIGVHTDPEKTDVLCTVDVDPDSPTYCQVREAQLDWWNSYSRHLKIRR